MVTKLGLWAPAMPGIAICATFAGGCSDASRGTTSDAAVIDTTRADVSNGQEGAAMLGPEADASTSQEGAAMSGGDAGDDGLGADTEGCHPIDISAFQPPTSVPMAQRSLACNGFNGEGGVVPSFRDSCLGHAPAYPPCASFDVGDAAGADKCYGCLVPATSDAASSTAVGFLATVAVVNYSSCIQLVDPTDAGAECALAMQSIAACVLFACQSTCPVTDESSVAAITKCMDEAEFGACAGYALRANACLAVEEGDGSTPVAAVCFPGSTPEQKYLSFAHYLCGGG